MSRYPLPTWPGSRTIFAIFGVDAAVDEAASTRAPRPARRSFRMPDRVRIAGPRRFRACNLVASPVRLALLLPHLHAGLAPLQLDRPRGLLTRDVRLALRLEE